MAGPLALQPVLRLVVPDGRVGNELGRRHEGHEAVGLHNFLDFVLGKIGGFVEALSVRYNRPGGIDGTIEVPDEVLLF